MKLFHLSDLHLGKRLNGYSLLGDQQYILERILSAVEQEAPQAVVIAGDVYDKATPSAEAVAVLDEFLSRLAALKCSPQVFVIYGNHDSAERLAFGNRLIEKSGVHLSPVFKGEVKPMVLTDEYGEVAFYLLPFVKPSDVRNAYPEAKVESYTDAVREALAHCKLDASRRNVLVAHQFVTGAARADSEDVSVGGLDNVDAAAFDGFDYVALGHLHRPQAVPGAENIRYCGGPLKYSVSEKDDQKGILVVELGAKGEPVACRSIPLTPLHDLREVKGTYDDVSLLKNYEGTATDDYIHVVLTDKNDVMDAMGRLRAIYPNILSLEYERGGGKGTGTGGDPPPPVKQKSDMEILAELYQWQNDQELSAEQQSFAEEIFKKLQEENH
ncbi:MAG: exonuclease SbcCD subunit D [Victivallales bacterium]|nr:exonuclease SbcCD subunit D [Victivallales bacterium]